MYVSWGQYKKPIKSHKDLDKLLALKSRKPPSEIGPRTSRVMSSTPQNSINVDDDTLSVDSDSSLSNVNNPPSNADPTTSSISTSPISHDDLVNHVEYITINI